MSAATASSPPPYTPVSATHSTFIGAPSPKPFPTRFPPPRFSPRLQRLASLRPLQLQLQTPTPTRTTDEKSALTMGSAAWVDTPAALEAGCGGGGGVAVTVGAAERAAVVVLLGSGFVVVALLVLGIIGGRF